MNLICLEFCLCAVMASGMETRLLDFDVAMMVEWKKRRCVFFVCVVTKPLLREYFVAITPM